MVKQMKMDFFSLRFLLIFFTIIVPLLSIYRNEFTTMGLLLSAFVVGLLVLNDEKFKLDKFFYSLPINTSSIYWGRVALVILFGILWVVLEVVPLAISGAIIPSVAAITILIQASMIAILVPSSLSALKLIKGKIVRWIPLIVGYFILIMVSLYFTNVFSVILSDPEMTVNRGTIYLSLASLVLFSIAYMFLSSRLYQRAISKKDKVS
jgi:hypothetical protein